MSNISVYLNSRASAASHRFTIEELQKYFFRHELRINCPESLEEMIELVKRDRSNKVECIFSIGGDGTCHTIAQHLIGSETKLMVLPGGTANDFADEIGTNGALKKLAHIFHAQSTKKVDIINVNGKYLMSNGGIGIAQEVASLVNEYRKSSDIFQTFLKASGKHAYQAVFAKHFLSSRFNLHKVYIESPDFPALNRKLESPLILINNQPKLAGSLHVAPETRNTDGKFNVTIFTHTNRFEFLKTALVFLTGKYPVEDKKIISFETSSLKMMSTTNSPLSFFGDGEIWAPAMELDIRIVPHCLEVFSPAEEITGKGYSLDEIPLLT
jgi:diacylglycerol kinase family enzyme